MKVGLIVECAPQGLEDVILPKIIDLLAIECKIRITYDIRTMVNKELLIEGCADVATTFLHEGYDRVLILWDENPPWTEQKKFAEKRCWCKERDAIRARLVASEVPLKNVGLVCVEHEFETILMYDTNLLRAVVSPSDNHPAKIKRVKDPLAIDDPTGWLERQFRIHKSRYNKAVVAKKFAANLNGLDALKRSDIFRRLADKILGQMPRGWDPCIYVPRGPKR